MRRQTDWTRWAQELTGPRFVQFQTELSRFNAQRLQPCLPEDAPIQQITLESRVAAAEIAFVESLRKAISPLTRMIPSDLEGFITWFEGLKETGRQTSGGVRSRFLTHTLVVAQITLTFVLMVGAGLFVRS